MINISNAYFAHSYEAFALPVQILNYCGGLTEKNMNVPKVDIKQLLEAGVHLGHKTLRWGQNEKIHFW